MPQFEERITKKDARALISKLKPIVDAAGTEYKWITIRCVDEEMFEGKSIFRIFNNKSGAQLGILSWYRPWKQYVFSSREECVFNNSCLKDVIDFMEKHA